MARFNATRIAFGKPPPAEFDDTADPLPKPATAVQKVRRMAGIREAADVLDKIPAPGESLHCLCTARMDLTDVVSRLIEVRGPVASLHVATLGYNKRNLATILGWLDTGTVKSITLLASIFFRRHKGRLWEQTLDEFRTRGHQAACCHSHAKVIALAFGDEAGTRMSIEGSANLCGNGSGREQFALFNDAGLHDWHAGWIAEMVTKHAAQASETAK